MTTPSHDAPTVLLGTVRTPPPRPAHVLGRYRVGTVLGRGGMSIVYRGEDTHTGRPVAIKVLAPHLAADPQYRRRLLAEARAVARLPHPHIVQILDVGEALTSSETASAPSPSAGRGGARPHAQNPRLLPGEKAGGGMRGRDEEGEGAVVLVMELVSGEGLDARIGRGPLPVGDVVAIGAQVADALAFAHRRGVVHRDVKPHNILLADSLWVKLTDFGIARTLDAATTLTAPGLILGSAPYIAPEVLEGRAVDARADVYALGVTLYQALTGRTPFAGETPAAALAARLTQEAPRVRQQRPEVPLWLDDLVARCLSRDPAGRIQDAAIMALALTRGHNLGKATTRPLSHLLEPAALRAESRVPSPESRVTPAEPPAAHPPAPFVPPTSPTAPTAKLPTSLHEPAASLPKEARVHPGDSGLGTQDSGLRAGRGGRSPSRRLNVARAVIGIALGALLASFGILIWPAIRSVALELPALPRQATPPAPPAAPAQPTKASQPAAITAPAQATPRPAPSATAVPSQGASRAAPPPAAPHRSADSGRASAQGAGSAESAQRRGAEARGRGGDGGGDDDDGQPKTIEQIRDAWRERAKEIREIVRGQRD